MQRARYRMARMLEEQGKTKDALEQYELTLKYSFDRDAELYVKLAGPLSVEYIVVKGRNRETGKLIEERINK